MHRGTGRGQICFFVNRHFSFLIVKNRLCLSPLHFFVAVVAGWINREQLQAIEYLQTECAVLRELLGKKRLRLDDDQRRRLAVEGRTLGRSRLARFATIVTPDTILRWHRQLIAQKWDFSANWKSQGRPPTEAAIAALT